MELAFSTLGVPGLPVADVLRLATTHGYHGVELRAHPEEPVHPGLGTAERADVAAAFKDAGVSVLGVAGYARLASDAPDDAVLDEVRGLVGLARDLGAPFVRVFPGGGENTDADADAARRLGVAAEFAADAGVRVLMETHDSHRTGADAARVLGAVGHLHAGALWDLMHTWLGGEDVTETFAALGPYLGYVQVKDVAGADDTTPVALGAGVLPVAECVQLLARRGWDGWLCWEYEKRWHEDAAPLAALLGGGRELLARLVSDSA
ncbi:3-dehydroshikimate dehydratase [Streptomyces sp. YIM 121038]|uniref:sugar phosphate isomerase/epimerase family protein n=1 Tax=Streptomyces sp. YIM 121038 TaxID=2136401 RepID=UPI001110EF3A|nr:sugar phosphate isomerase/epimerase family protein [Streptomyces sp. YIM 121038]QCX76725.1 3-dehydroshikimate dehydratase [Streptomyces sp. YIM 121038]